MAYQNSTLPFEKMPMKFLMAEDPMLEMLRWLCNRMMDVEFSGQIGAGKSERTESRKGYRAGYRPRRFDTRMGTKSSP